MSRLKIKRQRTCVGCQAKKLKDQMVRVVVNKKGELIIDKNQQLLGRGSYLCKSSASNKQINKECLKLALKRKAFDYAFRNQAKKIRIETLFNQQAANCSGVRSCGSRQNQSS